VIIMNKCTDGLDDRCRDRDGEIRHKRNDTKVATLRDTYGENFAPGFRSDAKLKTVLNQTGAKTLSDLIKKR
jgi:hypothetical protein